MAIRRWCLIKLTTLDILTPYPPYPPHAGGTAHIFQASRQLSRWFDVSLFTLAQQVPVRWGPMPTWCRELQAFPRAPVGPLRRVSLDPPAVQQEYAPAMAQFLHERWQRLPPTVVQIEVTSMAQYAPLARAAGALVVCTAQTLGFLAQLRRARQESRLALRMRRLAGVLSLWQYELRALRQCNLVVALGEADAVALRRWLPHLPVVFVPSGVDLDAWQPCFNQHATNEVLFVGNYAHPPNADGAQWLVREVWPLVRAARPAAHLTLAGRAPTAAIQALAAGGIRVPGTVNDLRELYRVASCVVAPIFWGGGVRIKLLEALACAMPIVTTTAAAEGIALEHGTSALYADQPAAFAAAIIRLLDDAALRAALGANGRALIERDYAWSHIGRKLAGLYYGALSSR